MAATRKIYFVSEHSNVSVWHGGIGPMDIEKILLRNNAIAIKFPYHFNFSIKAKIARFLYLIKTFLAVKRGSIVVFQHPLYARMDRILIRILRLRKTIAIICLIDDIDGLKDGDDNLLKTEMHSFKQDEYFIVHNSNMNVWLKSFHPDAKSSLLQCFDFLTSYEAYHRTKTNTIVFAGNLEKSRFLELLHIWPTKNPTLNINLYGPGLTDAMLQAKNVIYKGLHLPYSLPPVIEGSFGLIWDGDSIEQPSGSLGHYMHYINHHKLSLYVVCNLPVIVHENTGSAELITKFNIGFTVQNLFEIEDKIHGLSEAEYEIMVDNTRELAKEITSGNCLQKALYEIVSVIEEMK
jgi:glycosyltransferase involved in cell wall biosynthesis